MVEVLRRYSNRTDLVKIMVGVLRRIDAGDQADEPGVHSTGRGDGPRPVQEQYSEPELRQLVASFRAGTTIRELAERYGISESSVKRVLRLHRVSRRGLSAGG